MHELLAEIEIEPSNLSQQLAVLRRAGLVHQYREAGEVRYAVALPEVRSLLLAARRLLTTLIDEQAGLREQLQA